MPSYNITIDDGSPLIQYEGIWGDSSHHDAFWNMYANGTFHATPQMGDTAKFKFRGTAVYLYGAFRPNHGSYQVILDGDASAHDGAVSSDVYQTSMFSATNLSPDKEHEITLTNGGPDPLWVDLDYIIVTSGDGDDSTTYAEVTLDDDALNITYSGDWDAVANPSTAESYGQSRHRTSSRGASATVSFEGNAISIFGGSDVTFGTYAVTLDGTPTGSYNASAPSARPNTLLYQIQSLSGGSHTLTLVNQEDMLNFDLDSVVVSTWSTPSAIPAASSTPTPSPSPQSSKQSHTGAIVGGIIGAIVFLGCIALVVFLLLRQRRRRVHGSHRSEADLDKAPDNGNHTEDTDYSVDPFPVRNGLVVPLPQSARSDISTRFPASSTSGETDMPPPEYNLIQWNRRASALPVQSGVVLTSASALSPSLAFEAVSKTGRALPSPPAPQPPQLPREKGRFALSATPGSSFSQPREAGL